MYGCPSSPFVAIRPTLPRRRMASIFALSVISHRFLFIGCPEDCSIFSPGAAPPAARGVYGRAQTSRPLSGAGGRPTTRLIESFQRISGFSRSDR